MPRDAVPRGLAAVSISNILCSLSYSGSNTAPGYRILRCLAVDLVPLGLSRCEIGRLVHAYVN